MLTVSAAERPTAAAAMLLPWLTPTPAMPESSCRCGSRLSSSYSDNMRQFRGAAKRARESLGSSFQFTSSWAREGMGSYNSAASSVLDSSLLGDFTPSETILHGKNSEHRPKLALTSAGKAARRGTYDMEVSRPLPPPPVPPPLP